MDARVSALEASNSKNQLILESIQRFLEDKFASIDKHLDSIDSHQIGLDQTFTPPTDDDYRQGSDNKAVDALSRFSVSQTLAMDIVTLGNVIAEQFGENLAIKYPYHNWVDDLRRYNEGDPWISSKKQQVQVAADSTQSTLAHPPLIANQLLKFHIDNGLLKYNSRIVLSPDSIWRVKFYYLDYGHRDFAGNDSQYDQPPPRGNSGNGGSRCGPFKTWQSIYNYDIAFGLTLEEIKLVLGEEVA
uniref:Uncharacterized protein n=1 Tax=Salix viminalis TaxID=40686 RepID=A0A6N2KDA2_SALVM